MVDRVVKRAYQARDNWWGAVKAGVNLHGYYYYEIPPNLRYRYPAPGSCMLDKQNQPHMFKKHWKTPFRNSPYNIRPQYKQIPDALKPKQQVPAIPQFDETTEIGRLMMLEQQPKTDDLEIFEPAGGSLYSQEMKDAIWGAMEARQAEHEFNIDNVHPANNDFDHDYNPVQVVQLEGDWTGMESDTRMRMLQNEFERLIEDEIGKPQIDAGEKQMYKGTLKKWQVLDDDAHDYDQIVKMQAAVSAPLPEELEMYKEKHSVPMQLPFNNANVRAWRDDAKADESADFDPEFLLVDRERRKKFFIERFESPLQLKE